MAGVFEHGPTALLEAAGKHRELDARAEAAVEHRGEGLESRIQSAAARTQSSQHAAQHHSDAQAGAEATTAQEALLAAEAAEATGATTELTGEAAESGEGAETAAGSAEAVTVLESLLEAGLVRILRTEATAGLLQARLESRLIRVLTGHDAAILREALLEAGLEGILAGETAAPHHLLHLSQLLLHLLQLLLHHSLLEASLERVLRATKLAREALAGKAARLLHGEVVELLSLLTAALLLLAKKFAE